MQRKQRQSSVLLAVMPVVGHSPLKSALSPQELRARRAGRAWPQRNAPN